MGARNVSVQRRTVRLNVNQQRMGVSNQVIGEQTNVRSESERSNGMRWFGRANKRVCESGVQNER